jgi:hypothetical protein
MAQQHQEGNAQWARIHAGEMHVHGLLTPIIVIADDGRTAKTTFDSTGLETLFGIGHKPDAPGFPPPPKATDVGGEWPKPTRPQSDVWIYTGQGTPPLLPRPPVPYRTFSETFS